MVSQKLRFDVFKRDSFTCQYCGRKSPEVILEADHITPKSKGGLDTLDNLITSCRECNRGKTNSIIMETYESEENRIYTDLCNTISKQETIKFQLAELLPQVNELISEYHELQEQEFDIMIQKYENILHYVNEQNLRQFTGTDCVMSLPIFKSNISSSLKDITQNREALIKKMTFDLNIIIEPDGLLKVNKSNI